MNEIYKIQVNDSEPIEVSQQVYEVSFCFNEVLKEKDNEIERLNNIIKEQGLEDKSNYYVKGLEGSLKEYQDEVKRLNNIINEFDKWLENINIGELDDLFIGVKLSELKKVWNDIKGSDKEC